MQEKRAGGERAILLMGPTACGKTDLAAALVQHFPLEIISVDSAMVYRGMDIGTAKPDAGLLARAPHHLIDCIGPEQSYSAAQFREEARRLMGDIAARGRIPLLVGGTMLYFRALREGLNDLPSADPAMRAQIEQEAMQRGWAALHAELAQYDPQAALRIRPGDPQRIQRALEIIRLTGQPLSLLWQQPREGLAVRWLPLALVPSERTVLHDRIVRRFDAMLAAGLVEEVEGLRRRFALHADLPSMRCVGYRQVWAFLEGETSVDVMRERGIQATRQLAKRQLTWLRGMADLSQHDCLDPHTPGRLTDEVAQFLAG